MEKLKTAAHSLGRYFKNDNFKRFLSFVLCLCVVVGAFRVSCVKAHAAAPALVPIGAAAAGSYMTMTGMQLHVIAGGASAASAAISSAAGSYAAATGAAASGEAFLTAVGAGVSVSPAGLIILTAASAALLAGFCAWLYENYFAEAPAAPPILYSKYGVGDLIFASSDNTSNGHGPYNITKKGTAFTSVGQSVQIGDNAWLKLVDFNPASSNLALFRFVDSAGDTILLNGSAWTYVAGTNRTSSVPGIQPFNPDFPLYVAYMPNVTPVALRFMSYNELNNGYFVGAYYGTGNYASSLSFSDLAVYAGNTTFFSDEVEISDSGYEPITVPDNMSLGIDVGNPNLNIETLPNFIPDEIAAGSLSAAPSVIAPPVEDEEIDWNPALPDFADPTLPQNPGTGSPFLPDALAIPWHYVVSTLNYALSFISLGMIAFSNMVPTSAQIVIWAAVVLAVVFGLLRRFLG